MSGKALDLAVIRLCFGEWEICETRNLLSSDDDFHAMVFPAETFACAEDCVELIRTMLVPELANVTIRTI